ncbi:MAG: ATP-dependent DNA helicase RecG [Clostridia bacterium]|nr:ATP-dependent DNA helicase RecG [Clostridia bacterium]
MINLNEMPVSSIKGVGAKTAEALTKAGINTCLDLLRVYPRTYEDRTPRYLIDDAPLDCKVALVMRVTTAPRVAYTPTGKRIVRFSARQRENSPAVHIAFFNQTYLANAFHVGSDYRFYGRLTKGNGGYFMFSPAYEPIDAVAADTISVYPTMGALSSGKIAKLIKMLLSSILPSDIEDTLPESVRREHLLMPLGNAIFEIHCPTDKVLLEKAKERLVFDELFEFSLNAERLRRREDTDIVPSMNKVDTTPFIKALPFPLTSAQKRALAEIENDLTSTLQPHRAMRRLLQGDVGSGKTAVAAGAIYIAVKNGGKAYIMAPTEILACQHYETLSSLFGGLDIEVLLLTGSTTAKERRKIRERLISPDPLVLVGTHALFEEETVPCNLTLVVTDEQHRFGVNQREKLLSRATVRNNLVMSATPIPRTLAMFLYAGLDVSILDELPPGRQEISTLLIPPSKRERMYGFIEDEIRAGHQAYIICPLVEESEEEALEREVSGKGALTSATEMAESLKKRFEKYSVGLLHGKMKANDKNEVMDAFAKGEVQILVSTTVVEVGVNVPNATVMAIENADRFGLAQLHQLRGRIGRGKDKSWCIFITSSKSHEALGRLEFMTKCSDGFKIAEYDLEQRGPGDFFGERQHGELQLPLASTTRDISLFQKASASAKRFLDEEK